MSEDRTKLSSLKRSIAIGAIGFGLVSLFVFATVAFGERRMYQNFGLLGAYLAWTVTFIVLSAAVFGTLVVGRWRLPKFYLLFGFAFFAYAVAWMIAYYSSPNTAGEVIGSLAGSVLMALVFALAFESIEIDCKTFRRSLRIKLSRILYRICAEQFARRPNRNVVVGSRLRPVFRSRNRSGAAPRATKIET